MCAAALLLLRLPSLVQPMGADQSLYAYVGDRIRAGGLPYRDAWDQKPPAIHFLYAGLRARVAGRRRRRRCRSASRPALRRAAAVSARRDARSGRRRATPRRCSSCCCRTRRSPGSAASGCARSARRSSPSRSPARCCCSSRGRNGPSAAAARRRRRAVRPRVHVQVQRRRLRRCRRSPTAVADASTDRRARAAPSAPGSCVPVAGAACWCSRSAAALPAAVRRDDPLQPPVLAARPTPGAIERLPLPARLPDRTGARRCAVDCWAAPAASCCWRRACSQRDRASIPVIWVAAACAVDRDQRQPQPAAVLHPGAIRRWRSPPGWGGALAWTWIAGSLGRRARIAAVPLAAGRRHRRVARRTQFPKLVEQTALRRAARARPDPTTPPTSPATTTTGSTRRSAATTLGEYLQAHSAPADRVYVFGFTCAAYVYGESHQRLALLLEPAGDRRVSTPGRPATASRAAVGARRRTARRSSPCSSATGRPTSTTRRRSSWPRRALVRLAAGATTSRRRGRTASTSGCATERDAVSAPAALTARHVRRLARGHRPAGARAARLVPDRRSALGRPPSASSGTTKGRGSTTRATRRCSAPGAQDAWNPMYIAPVFTGLEYVSFATFGVGVWQARLVSEVTGFALGAAARASASGGSPDARPGVIAARAARDQLRLRHVEPGGADGSVDGRVHGRRLVLLRARADAAALGPARRRVRAARLLHQGRGRLLRRRARRRGARRACCRPSSDDRRRAAPRQGGDHDAVGARRSAALLALAVFVAAELDRVSLLQLADVGHAQAELRPALAARIG